MSIYGTESIDDKLNCIIEKQADISERVNNIEKSSAVDSVVLYQHLKTFSAQVNTDIDIQRQISTLLQEVTSVHAEQKILLEERRDSIKFWKCMKERIATAGVLGAIGLLGSVIWYGIQQYLIHGPKG